MLAYALLAMFQEPEVGWDLSTMWGNMSIIAKVGGRTFFSSCPRGRSAS